MPSIRDEIDRAARKAGYTKRQDLAKALKLSQAHMSDLLNGNRQFTPEMMKAVVRLLRVTQPTALRWHRWGAKAAGWKI